jgi:hypothetical protein
MASNGDAPDELPSDVLRAMIEQEQKAAPAPALRTVYSAEATAWALQHWEDAGVNASEERPWRGDYQRAVTEISPRLSAYNTLDKLVAAFYEGALYLDVVRVALLRDGRQLDVETIHAAVFWRRWRVIQCSRSCCSRRSASWRVSRACLRCLAVS